ncbi:hypothetical protein C9F11_38220 [Streptomyces sp. YIM 121038]|uniref:hypothetical protein n=1 Tax=Streptomyces sp. YIM 121038 TaxID=2136401 RepID=UPI001163A974|nr:hypothetical protein [Streptomyces sp. YIM 121038]QCX81227.1 hypothetical protein C9F11_38220 [Streptomyces sp. YIM 121038]
MSWKKDRAEIRELMAARPDPDGKHGCESQEAVAVNAELDRKLREQPVWRRARALYED